METSDKLRKATRARSRKRAIEAGAYDGRLSTRVEKDRKKDLYKTYRRNKHKITEP